MSTDGSRTARFEPGSLRGELSPPPDKSISHRAAIVGAMSTGKVEVRRYLESADTRSTLRAIEALGAHVEESESPLGGAIDVSIEGVGLRGARGGEPSEPLSIDVGNAGTLMRLLPGWLAGQPAGSWSLAGDDSIARRPVDRITRPLGAMGAELEARDGRLPPLVLSGTALRGIRYELPVASAQVKSCVLLAGLTAEGPTTVVEPVPTRDHTERMLRGAGVRVTARETGTGIAASGRLPGREIVLEPPERVELGAADVPGDLSSAAFALCGALIARRSDVVIEDVGLNPTRVGLLGILNRMGAVIEVVESVAGPEPIGRIRARTSALRGVRVGASEVALAIDELPLIALLGCFAEGATVVSGAEELRHKESDRIDTVVEAIGALGGRIEARPDGFKVEGTGGIDGGTMRSSGDHRLAMLGAVAGMASRDGVEVVGMDACEVSYPGFESDLAALVA
ncbi:3-phosphoshikimate 1-carboxyvinyltransferase [Thermoleophilia bacterium SCSIO 60948]|nr:3-phosphoshikimate 1-carboxyvinyltransferase [Thermoleophilia bacterium SCSIO 60948]